MSPATHRAWLLTLAFTSGSAALIYQVVWLRWFQVLFGSTAYAASATLCAFFAGLALGAAVFGRMAARTRHPLRAYAALEAGAALLALLVPLVFALYDAVYGAFYARLAGQRGLFVAVKFVLAFAVMVPPALLLGGTLPLLASAFVRRAEALGREGGILYAVNTLGAAGGSAAAAFWLPEALGFRGAYAVALSIAGLTAVGALWLSRDDAERAHDAAPLHDAAQAPASPAKRAADAAPAGLRAVAFASGFGTLAFEVLLIHALAQLLDQSVYSFGAVLLVVLLALAAGAAVVAVFADRVAPTRLLAGALGVESLLLLGLPGLMVYGPVVAHGGPAQLGDGLRLAALYGGVPLFVGALVLPLTFRLAAGGSVGAGGAGGVVGRRLGGLLAANTLGGILGSLAASFLLLDVLGLWNAIAVLGVGYGVAALLVPGSGTARLARGALLLAAVAVVALGSWDPRALPLVHLEPGETLVDQRDGAHGVVSVVAGEHGLRMKLDNRYTLSGQGRFSALKERAGHLPLLLHPDPKRVLYVGSATGNTAGAAVPHAVEEIVLVEIVPEVHELAAKYFAAGNRNVHHDPRTRLVVEDGRNHLRATADRYDVVVADLFVPWRRGVGSLYSQEHFEAVRRHLTPEGVFCQWLPLYQLGAEDLLTILATFREVFPGATLWRGDFYARTLPRIAVVGFAGAPPRPEQVEARVRELAGRGVEDRWVTDPRGFFMLYVGALRDLDALLGSVPRNRDDRPTFEFRAGRTTPEERRALLHGRWPALVELLSRGGEAGAQPFGPVGVAGARSGAALARANRRILAGDDPVAVRAVLRTQVPVELLSPPDPTAAEMWLVRPGSEERR